MSVASSSGFIRPVGAVCGDVIVLTKPLGTQVAVNCKQWMREDGDKWNNKYKQHITREEVTRAFHIAQTQMSTLNRTAATLMKKHHAHAATDVTGFGTCIYTHAQNIHTASEVH